MSLVSENNQLLPTFIISRKKNEHLVNRRAMFHLVDLMERQVKIDPGLVLGEYTTPPHPRPKKWMPLKNHTVV